MWEQLSTKRNVIAIVVDVLLNVRLKLFFKSNVRETFFLFNLQKHSVRKNVIDCLFYKFR